jgi:hypothetical protein
MKAIISVLKIVKDTNFQIWGHFVPFLVQEALPQWRYLNCAFRIYLKTQLTHFTYEYCSRYVKAPIIFGKYYTIRKALTTTHTWDTTKQNKQVPQQLQHCRCTV